MRKEAATNGFISRPEDSSRNQLWQGCLWPPKVNVNGHQPNTPFLAFMNRKWRVCCSHTQSFSCPVCLASKIWVCVFASCSCLALSEINPFFNSNCIVIYCIPIAASSTLSGMVTCFSHDFLRMLFFLVILKANLYKQSPLCTPFPIFTLMYIKMLSFI